MQNTTYRWALAVLVLGLGLFYFLFWRDPIFRMEIAAARNPMFYGGLGMIVHLPENASLEQVIKATSEFGQNIRITEMKKLWDRKIAVLVDSERGEKIALVQYDGAMGWMVQMRDP